MDALASPRHPGRALDGRVALGLPSLAGYSLSQALGAAASLGFRSIMTLPGGPRTEHSLGPFPTLDYYGATAQEKERLRESLGAFEHLSLHQAWDDRWRDWIDCAAYLGAEIVTVHAGLGGADGDALSRRWAYLQQLGDYAGAHHILIGVENEGGPCAAYVELIEGIDHPSVGATIDVGHCAYWDEVKAKADSSERALALNDTLASVVGRLGQRIVRFHMHNVRSGDWRDHRSVPDGVIDFPRLLALCADIGYGGGFDIELEEEDREGAARASGTYLDSLMAISS